MEKYIKNPNVLATFRYQKDLSVEKIGEVESKRNIFKEKIFKFVVDFIGRHEYGTEESLSDSFGMYCRNEKSPIYLSDKHFMIILTLLLERGDILLVECGKNNPNGRCFATKNFVI